MMKHSALILLFLLAGICITHSGNAQNIQPGFDKAEYIEFLKITAHQTDTPWTAGSIPLPEHFHLAYRSPVTGLDNRWDLWLRNDGKLGIINVRGTTGKSTSWLENFYSAMIPAAGSIQLSDSQTFKYHLTPAPQAAVHIGWMIGLGFMSESIVAQIREQYASGVHEFIISGHSQGGAIAYLLTSYLYDLRSTGKIPHDIVFKTYCSAAPKPGNLYYAYSYEQLTNGGWGYNVVNPADWVPQTPFSVQTIGEQPAISPFKGARKSIRSMGFPKNLVIGYMYGRLEGGTRKAQRRFEKYLGNMAGGQVRKALPGYKQPAFYPSADYVRTGNIISLSPDSGYYQRFPDTSSNVFIHHMMPPYLYLINKY
jgi:hypothetical protein